MRDPDEAADGPPDPDLDPERSPGFGEDSAGLDDIEVGRDDVTIGEATPRELTASDTNPVADDEAVALIHDLARGDVVDRRRAALALGSRERSDPVVQALSAAGRTDEDADVRQFAVESLGKVGGETAAETAAALTDDLDPWVRAEAYVTLDRLDRERYAPTIETGLDDDHHAVRRNAAISVFKHRGEDALGALLDQVDDESERVREWAAHLLGGVDDDRAREALRTLADDESKLVRQTARRALEVDPGRFRRQFSGAMDEGKQPLPGEDTLNRRPDL